MVYHNSCAEFYLGLPLGKNKHAEVNSV